jgi:hypothetical protein
VRRSFPIFDLAQLKEVKADDGARRSGGAVFTTERSDHEPSESQREPNEESVPTMTSDIRRNRLLRDDADQKLLEGAQRYTAVLPSLTLRGQSYAPADLVQILQDRLAASLAVQTARAAYRGSVQTDRDKHAQTDAAVKALKGVVQGMFPESVDTLAEFGLRPRKVRTTTVAAKAGAIAKNAATREARHTMGKRQKLAIKGTPPTAQ